MSHQRLGSRTHTHSTSKNTHRKACTVSDFACNYGTSVLARTATADVDTSEVGVFSHRWVRLELCHTRLQRGPSRDLCRTVPVFESQHADTFLYLFLSGIEKLQQDVVTHESA